MLASIDFAECDLTEVLTELMNGLPSSNRLADLLIHEYNVYLLHKNICMCVWCLCNNNDTFFNHTSTIHTCTDLYVIKIHYTRELSRSANLLEQSHSSAL